MVVCLFVFAEIDKDNLKRQWEYKGPRCQDSLEGEQDWRIYITIFQDLLVSYINLDSVVLV